MNQIRQALDKLHSAKQELKSLGVIRSERLTAEIGEYIASTIFEAELATSTSNKGWDMKTSDGIRIQVKAHAKGLDNHYGYTHVPDFKPFDELVIVVMTPDYRIKAIYKISSKEAQNKSKWNDKAQRFEVPWKSLENNKVTIETRPSDIWKKFGTV